MFFDPFDQDDSRRSNLFIVKGIGVWAYERGEKDDGDGRGVLESIEESTS
jgi:hypothetical protein